MSIPALNAVWAMDIEPKRKLVLLAYADHAHEDGTHIYPSIARIVEKTGLSRRWVQVQTRELAAAGLLISDGRGPRGQNRWRIALPSSEAIAPLSAAQGASPANREAGTIAQAAAAIQQTVQASSHFDPRVDSAPPTQRKIAARLSKRAAASVENAPPGASAAEAAPTASAAIAVENAPPATSALSSPVHSSASGGEVEFTPGAYPSAPEPSLTIKEPPIQDVLQEETFEEAVSYVPDPAGAGPAYENRERIPQDLLPYADVFHELTGLVPTQRVLQDWISAFKTWRAEGILVDGVRRAHKEARYSIARPGSLTNMAAAFSARRTAGANASKGPEWERRANEIMLWTIEQGRIRAAEGYKAMHMPFEDPATMLPSIADLRKELEGTQPGFLPMPVSERGPYLDRIDKLLPPGKRRRWPRR